MMLQVEGVWTYYDRIAALQGIDFCVDEGEVVALIGANGAGKTTSLNTVCGVTPARRGKVIFDGQEITGLEPHVIARLGIAHVPEGRRVFPQMSVAENLLMGAYLRSDSREISRQREQVLTLFPRLAERQKQMAGTLSGGEQQMLAIGRALMSKPRLLLLDEPSMGLAPILVEDVFRALGQINAAGITMLLVEQNAQMALQLAHRAYVLETGTVKISGTASGLLHDPRVEEAYLGL